MNVFEAILTKEEVLRTHTEVFYRALKDGDYNALAKTYSDDYMLVRPDGSVLNREQVLEDLRDHGLTFHSIELWDSEVRIYGSAAILTGESRTIASRNGDETSAHFRFVAIYIKENASLRLAHFQSTSLPA